MYLRWRYVGDIPFQAQRQQGLLYKCNRRHDYRYLADCAEPSVLASQADLIVWTWLAGLLDYADRQYGRLETLVSLITKGERQIKRLASDLSDLNDKGDNDDEEDDGRNAIMAEIQAASKRLKAYRAERDEINPNLANEVMTDERRALIVGGTRSVW